MKIYVLFAGEIYFGAFSSAGKAMQHFEGTANSPLSPFGWTLDANSWLLDLQCGLGDVRITEEEVH